MHGMNEKWKREVSVCVSFILHTFENITHNTKHVSVENRDKRTFENKNHTHGSEIMHFAVEWDTNDVSEYTDIVWIYV